MKTRAIQSLVFAAIFAGSFTVAGAEGQAPVDKLATNAATQSVTAAASAEAAKSQPSPKVSRSVADVVKLSKAGLELKVIESFLDQSGNALPPSADEIVYLREQGVSQEVIAALIRRGSAVKMQVINIVTQEDRVRDAMLEARQRAMFAREYPPVPQPASRVYSPGAPYPAYGYDYYAAPYFVPHRAHHYNGPVR